MPVTTQLKQWGNSQAIRISKDIASQLDLKVDDVLELKVEENKIILKKKVVSKRKKIEELFKDYEGYNDDKPVDFGQSVGEEYW